MERRRAVFVWIVLLAVGVVAGAKCGPTVLWRLRTRGPVGPEEVRLHAVDLLQVLRPELAAPELPERFRKLWADQRRRFPPERLAELRSTLEDYVVFVETEYAECADIYQTAPERRPERLGDAATEARRRLRASFGDAADELIRQADELREQAFTTSPRVLQGSNLDPEHVNFVEEKARIRVWSEWARMQIAELTAPPDDEAATDRR